ncbi:MAG: molybdenum cofactor biosynthesis protein, partial [Deltaproteobacteria bacterium]
MAIKAGIVTVSDKGARGEREDRSGALIEELLEGIPAQVVFREVVPDEVEEIRRVLLWGCDEMRVDLIVTTGGTGVAPRDVTPEAT